MNMCDEETGLSRDTKGRGKSNYARKNRFEGMRVLKNHLLDVVPYTIVSHVDLALRIGSDIFSSLTVAMWNRCKGYKLVV